MPKYVTPVVGSLQHIYSEPSHEFWPTQIRSFGGFANAVAIKHTRRATPAVFKIVFFMV